jgi:hypothetical protein
MSCQVLSAAKSCQRLALPSIIDVPSPRSISVEIALLFKRIGVIDVMTAERGNKEKRL